MAQRPFQLMSVGVFVVAAACSAPNDRGAPDTASVAKILTRGSLLQGTNGILFGPDGLLYVASVVTPAIAAIDVDTGDVVRRLGPDSLVRGPDDLAFGDDGSLYWTDISIGDVGKLAPDGTASVVASPGPGVNPITFSDDGRLFVSQCFFGDKLFEIDPEGVDEPRLVTDQLGPGCGLNGMDWGPDGRLYGPRWFQGEVVKVDVDSGEFERVAGGFGVPAAVKFDSVGRLHVLDSLRGEIVRLEGDERSIVGRVEPSSADNLAFDANDRLFVSSFGDGSIVEILDSESTKPVLPGGLNMPGGVAIVDAQDGPVIYIADFFALRGFSATGEQVYVARDIIGFSDLGSVMSVDFDGENLILSSWFDNMVRVWDPSTDSLVAAFEGFGRPIDAIAYDGDIVVTEYDTGSVLRFDPEHAEVRTAIATGIESPAGLARSGQDLYVSDRGSGRVLRILAGGTVVSPPETVVRGLQGPEGISMCGRYLCVVESEAGRVSTIDLATGERTTLADGIAIHVPSQGGFPPTMLLNDVASSGDMVYFAADLESSLLAVPVPN